MWPCFSTFCTNHPLDIDYFFPSRSSFLFLFTQFTKLQSVEFLQGTSPFCTILLHFNWGTFLIWRDSTFRLVYIWKALYKLGLDFISSHTEILNRTVWKRQSSKWNTILALHIEPKWRHTNDNWNSLFKECNSILKLVMQMHLGSFQSSLSKCLQRRPKEIIPLNIFAVKKKITWKIFRETIIVIKNTYFIHHFVFFLQNFREINLSEVYSNLVSRKKYELLQWGENYSSSQETILRSLEKKNSLN